MRNKNPAVSYISTGFLYFPQKRFAPPLWQHAVNIVQQITNIRGMPEKIKAITIL